MRPSPYETAILAFLADGKPRTLREIGKAAGCRNPGRVVAKLQRSIRVRRLPVKLKKETRKKGGRVVVYWQIIGPPSERRSLILKGIEAGILFFTKTKFHGLEGNRNAAILEDGNVCEFRLTVSMLNKPLVETIAILEGRSVASCVRDALSEWVEAKAREHRLGKFRNAKIDP